MKQTTFVSLVWQGKGKLTRASAFWESRVAHLASSLAAHAISQQPMRSHGAFS